MKKNLISIARYATLFAFALITLQSSYGQAFLDSVAQDESKIVSAIAPYPADMRAAILDVSQYPQTLVKLKRVQMRTSQKFQDIISMYPREEQENFYQLSRFPELTKQLLDLGSQNMESARAIISSYPEGSRSAISDVYLNHFDELSRIKSLYESTQNVLERVTAKYPSLVQDDFKKVIDSPDVMSLLIDNIDLTVSLGESYKNDPQGIVRYLDSRNAEITKQDAKDLEEYKAAVATDPKLQEEMKKAADEFATQFDQQAFNPVTVNNNYYGSAPYPYWFGYPYWYAGPMWYPTPFYYNTGFYYGTGGNLIVFGLPSFAYATWFFGGGYSRYPGLYNHYRTYYNVHRTDVANVNVYRGFNTAARNHFNTIGRSTHTVYPNGTAIRRESSSRSRNISSMPTRSVHQPMNGAHFNNGGFNHYNANSFHSMSWGGMHGGGVHGRR
jgi:hypothetical protein